MVGKGYVCTMVQFKQVPIKSRDMGLAYRLSLASWAHCYLDVDGVDTSSSHAAEGLTSASSGSRERR